MGTAEGVHACRDKILQAVLEKHQGVRGCANRERGWSFVEVGVIADGGREADESKLRAAFWR